MLFNDAASACGFLSSVSIELRVAVSDIRAGSINHGHNARPSLCVLTMTTITSMTFYIPYYNGCSSMRMCTDSDKNNSNNTQFGPPTILFRVHSINLSWSKTTGKFVNKASSPNVSWKYLYIPMCISSVIWDVFRAKHLACLMLALSHWWSKHALNYTKIISNPPCNRIIDIHYIYEQYSWLGWWKLSAWSSGSMPTFGRGFYGFDPQQSSQLLLKHLNFSDYSTIKNASI